jgi:tetratricopeptide (TPR) repeat protein
MNWIDDCDGGLTVTAGRPLRQRKVSISRHRFHSPSFRFTRSYGSPAVACLLLAASLGWARPPHVVPSHIEDVIRQAEEAWQHRDLPGQTQAAIAAWEVALAKDPQRLGLYIPLTKACGRAYRNCESREERERWADQARTYGALAVEKNPDSPEAYAEYGEALGQWAQAHKGIRSLRVVKEAVNSLEKALSLNPKYAFAHMLLARFYEQAPGWISVGDKKKALVHARLAVDYGPGYAINHLTLAKVYLARGNKADARKELERIMALTPPPDAVPETRADQDTAREMLKGL